MKKIVEHGQSPIHFLISFLKAGAYYILFLLLPFNCFSALSALDDERLSQVDGAGIGLVLENFSYNTGKDIDPDGVFEISGLSNSAGQDVVISVSQFYVAGSGSNEGANVEGTPVNIGRLIDPYTIELVDGDDIGISDKAVLQFATSSSSRSSELIDIGNVFDVNVNGSQSQSLEIHWKDLNIDSSVFRFWAGTGRMEGEINLSLIADELTFFACESSGNNCGNRINFEDLNVNLKFGDGSYQPVTYNVLNNGHFTFEIESLQGKCQTHSGSTPGGCSGGAERDRMIEFYDNGPESNIYINNVVVGGTSFGSNTISGFEVQYLKVTSHDLQ